MTNESAPDLANMRVQTFYPWFDSQIEPLGHLTHDRRCHACWYFYLIAHNAKVAVGKGPDSQTLEYEVGSGIMDMPLWMDKRYAAQARSVTMIYGLDSPDEMFQFWPVVVQEAMRLGMPNPEFEYMNPPAEDRIT